jgi:hypothetical protein
MNNYSFYLKLLFQFINFILDYKLNVKHINTNKKKTNKLTTNMIALQKVNISFILTNDLRFESYQ